MSKLALGKGLSSLIPQKASAVSPSPVITAVIEKTHQILDVPVEHIVPNPRQPRVYFSDESLQDLVASILEHGIMQPLVVTATQTGTYELIAGERRLRASKQAGLKTVPVIVRDANDQQKLELALIENIQRQELNAIEEALAYQALIDQFDMTQEMVSQKVGKSRPVVANTLRLLVLPQEIQNAIVDGTITKTHARTLLTEVDPTRQQQLFSAMRNGDLTVQQATARLSPTRKTRQNPNNKNPQYLADEQSLREWLGTKVNISEKGGQGMITIHFFSKDEYEEILNRMQQ